MNYFTGLILGTVQIYLLISAFKWFQRYFSMKALPKAYVNKIASFVQNWIKRNQRKLVIVTQSYFDLNQLNQESFPLDYPTIDMDPSCTVFPPKRAYEAFISSLLGVIPNFSSLVIEAPIFLDPFIKAIKQSKTHQSGIQDIFILVTKLERGLNGKLRQLFDHLPKVKRIRIQYDEGLYGQQDLISILDDLIKRRNLKAINVSPPEYDQMFYCVQREEILLV